jgi:hypothetical protein
MGKKMTSPKRGQPAEREQPSTIGDIAVVWGRNENGLYILRRRTEEAPVEAGLLQPLVEGRPISGEVISMRRRGDAPFLFDVKTEVAASGAAEPSTTSHGPSQVATESYRKGWDAIWGGNSDSDSGSASASNRRNRNLN